MGHARSWAQSVGIATALAMGAPAIGAEPGLEWRQLTSEEARLVFYAPGLQGGLERFYRSRDSEEFHVQEVGRWVGPSGRYPHAQIVFVELGPRFHFSRRVGVQQDIGEMYEAMSLSFEEARHTRNVIGKIYYVEYFVETEKCLGFSQYFGVNYDNNSTWTEGNSKLLGYYCVSAAEPMPTDKIAAILGGIGVKGVMVPEPPAYEARSEPVPGPTAIIDCLLPERAATSLHTGDFTRKRSIVITTGQRCVAEGGRILSPEEAKSLK